MVIHFKIAISDEFNINFDSYFSNGVMQNNFEIPIMSHRLFIVIYEISKLQDVESGYYFIIFYNF